MREGTNQIINEYFNWLFNIVCRKRFSKDISYKKLITHLHNVKFKWTIPEDSNRALDGIELRWRFACETGREKSFNIISRDLSGDCSVLEMLVALAIRCEETIMDDPRVGDRTGQWFWGMVSNLGLGGMTDSCFDKQEANDKLEIFMNREYSPNGKGGLFTIRNCKYDLRDVEIWKQLCWYLDNL